MVGYRRQFAQMKIMDGLSRKLQAIRAERGSPKTLEWYEDNISLFVRYLSEQEIDPVLSNLTVENVEAWLVQQGEDGLSSSTLENRVRCLKAFCRFLYDREYLKVNQLDRLKKPRVIKEDIDIVEPWEIQKLLNSIGDKKAIDVRDRVLIALMYETGLRCGEVANLKLDDLSLEDQFIRVRATTTKSRKPRVVPLGDRLCRMLTTYLDFFRDKHDIRNNIPSDYLFRSRTGQKISVNGIEQMLTKRCDKAGIKHINPHLLRHSNATISLEGGLPELILQQRLGHSTLQMTGEYTRQVARREVKKGAAFSLLDHIEVSETKVRKPRSDRGKKRKVEPRLRVLK